MAEPGRLFTRWKPEEAAVAGVEERAHRPKRPNQAMSFRGEEEGWAKRA